MICYLIDEDMVYLAMKPLLVTVCIWKDIRKSGHIYVALHQAYSLYLQLSSV